MWMEFIFTIICILGVTIHLDEMTMNFKGYNADQIKMTNKAEGDGLQADALCNKGYTHIKHLCALILI